MEDDAHRIRELEKEIVRLNQEMKDNNKAVILAERVSSAQWMSALSMLGTIIAIAISLLSRR